jgi:hypothetical protein
MTSRLPRAILISFALALILITAPPLHWALSGPQRVLGLPIAVAYIVGAGLFATISIVTAYFVDPSRGKA